MKLHQLRYLAAVADHDLNITAAALSLHTVQPGVSKQLMLLEAELGFSIFVRRGRALTRITPAGEQVLARARQILRDVQEIKSLAAEWRRDEEGTLTIATTHTQARYVLPGVLQKFRAAAPRVQVHLHQGDVEQIAQMSARERIDVAIATGSEIHTPNLVRLPCYRWRRVVVVPNDHPLSRIGAPTLAQLAAYPLISYSFSFSGPSSLLELFTQSRLDPDIALTALDADVLKTYIRSGLGVGILAQLAIDPIADADLTVIDASHLFPEHVTWVGIRRGILLRRYIYDFLHLLAPQYSRRDIQSVQSLPTQEGVDAALADRAVPLRQQWSLPVTA